MVCHGSQKIVCKRKIFCNFQGKLCVFCVYDTEVYAHLLCKSIFPLSCGTSSKSIFQSMTYLNNDTYRSVRFMRFDNFNRSSISHQNGLGISQPGSVHGLSTKESANGCGSTVIALQIIKILSLSLLILSHHSCVTLNFLSIQCMLQL